MLVHKRIPIGILLCSCLFAVPAGAQDDPYAAIERPLQALDSPEANAHTAACDSTCFSLVWAAREPVIDVTASGGVGVEGAAAGTLQDPNDGFLKIYIAHGYSFGDTNALRIYNIATDTWSIGPSTGRDFWSEGSGAAVGTKLYSIAGRNAGAQTFPHEIFDAATGTWSSGAAMPTAREGFGTAVLGGKVHAIGGRLGGAPLSGGAGLTAHEVYDPGTNSWSLAAPLPVAVGDNYATAAVGGRAYVVGGWNGGANVTDTQIYDAGTDSWSAGANAPHAVSNALAGVLNGRVVVIGGIDDTLGNSTHVQIYDPVFDTWCSGPAKPTAASEISVSGANPPNAIHAIGSGAFGLSSNVHEVLLRGSPGCVCPLSQGGWKNTEVWPVGGLQLGDIFYVEAELRDILSAKTKGDSSIILAKQLIAAKLSYAAGAERPDAITQAILDADALLAGGGAIPQGVKSSDMTALASVLDAFNQGSFTPGCSDVICSLAQ